MSPPLAGCTPDNKFQEYSSYFFTALGGNSPHLEHLTTVLRAIYVGHHLLDPMIEAWRARARGCRGRRRRVRA